MALDLSDIIIPRKKFTQDFRELLKKKRHKVFVYGTLKQDQRLQKVFDPKVDKPLGVGVTVEKFDMIQVKTKDFNFPVILSKTGGKLYRVKGELWETDIDIVCELDQIESNGVMYVRKPISVYIGKQIHTAFTYIGVVNYWSRHSYYDVTPENNLYDWRDV